MRKGKNGQQVAAENVSLVLAWVEERNKRRDWDEYSYNNRINRSVVAAELNFAKSVCTQNEAVRGLLAAADAIWFKSEQLDKAAHQAARQRAESKSKRVSSDNSELNKRIAELEIENRQLRRELDAYKRQAALIQGGSSGFRL